MLKKNSLRVLHTADWHLGKKLEYFSRHEEQIEVMNEICQIADEQEVHLVIVAGDLFDTFNPPAESQDLFYKTLYKLTNHGKRAVIAIAGNHDMPERIEAPHPLAQTCGIIFSGFPDTKVPKFEVEDGLKVIRSENGFVEIILPGFDFPVRLLLTPYANEIRLKTCLNKKDSEEDLRQILAEQWKTLSDKYCDDKGVNILAAHLYFMKKGGLAEAEPDGEKSILHIGGAQAIFSENVPQPIQYVALGHLHRYHEIDKKPCPIVYSSSPLCYSFAEADQKKQVVIVELEPAKHVTYKAIELSKGRPLKRGRFNDIEKAVTWLNENKNAYVEVTLITETFLDGAIRKRLADVHDHIVDVIPELKSSDMSEDKIDLMHLDENKDMASLFKEYFKYKNETEPSESMMDLLKEVLGEEEEQ
jgi:exonuclease SbcD